MKQGDRRPRLAILFRNKVQGSGSKKSLCLETDRGAVNPPTVDLQLYRDHTHREQIHHKFQLSPFNLSGPA